MAGLELFKEFIKQHNYIRLNNDNNVIENNLFNNKQLCFTGFRDKDLEEYNHEYLIQRNVAFGM